MKHVVEQVMPIGRSRPPPSAQTCRTMHSLSPRPEVNEPCFTGMASIHIIVPHYTIPNKSLVTHAIKQNILLGS